MLARVLIAGTLILLAVAHVTITATGGYQAHAYLTLAIAFGVACGSVCCGMAWAAQRHSLAVLFVVCIVGGEAFGFMQTANRLIAANEATQARLRERARAHAKSLQRLDDAKAAVANAHATSVRLEKAEAAKAKADTAVTAQSSLRDCREHCRHLLQAQVDAAEREIANARAEFEAGKVAALRELADAQRVLDALKAPESPTPLADRTGVPAWVLDLVTASLGSIAANGLACCLMMFGAHHGAHRIETVAQMAAKPDPVPVPTIDVDPDPGTFLVSALEPGEAVRENDVCAEYERWCRDRGCTPIPRAQFKAAFQALCDQSGFRRGRGKVHGMQLTAKARPLCA